MSPGNSQTLKVSLWVELMVENQVEELWTPGDAHTPADTTDSFILYAWTLLRSWSGCPSLNYLLSFHKFHD